jgi:hypothetical protein
MDRIRATSEVGPLKSQLHTRGYDIPAVRCIQRVVRRHLAKAKRDITQDELDQLIARAAVCIQRTASVRRYLRSRADQSHRFQASDAIPFAPDLAVTVKSHGALWHNSPLQSTNCTRSRGLEDTDDAASAASTTRDITTVLLGLLLGSWSSSRRRSRRTRSLCPSRHTQTTPACKASSWSIWLPVTLLSCTHGPGVD